jgi:hypothetical protein
VPRLRRNGGLGQLEPREGVITHVEPEVRHGGRGDNMPTGTREHAKAVPQPEPIRNGLPFTAYDPSETARAARAADPAYRHARLALARAEQAYGRRPTTIRGLLGADAVRNRHRRKTTGG